MIFSHARRPQAAARSSPSRRPMFEVVSGLHSGVTLWLESGDHHIGSAPEADIVLRDPGIAPDHALLSIKGRNVRLEAIGGDIGLVAGSLAKGHGCRERLPLDLSLGEAQLRISLSDEPSAGLFNRQLRRVGQPAARRPLVLLGAAVGCFYFVSVMADSSSEAPRGLSKFAVSAPATPGLLAVDTDRLEHREASLRARGETQGSTSTISTPSTIDEAAQQLAARVRDAGLQAIRIRIEEGRLAAFGSLDKRQASAWTVIQQWFDQTYGGRVFLLTDVTFGTSRATPNLQLRAIWFGEHPYIISADGTRRYEGAVLNDGWVIQEIGETRAVLKKGDDTFALTYR
jgi:type III secretion system (T3SS) inner membrane Yop/YscD-like protein/type III secretion system (T3SS) inner membrane Yop/CscD-like protein